MDDLEHYFEELKLKRIPEIYKEEAKIAAEKKLVSSQSYNVVKYISYVPHIQLEGIKHEEIHCDAY